MLYRIAIISLNFILLVSCSFRSIAEEKKKAIKTCSDFALGHFGEKLSILDDTLFVLTEKDFNDGTVESKYRDKAAFSVIITLESPKWSSRSLYFVCDQNGNILNKDDYEILPPTQQISK